MTNCRPISMSIASLLILNLTGAFGLESAEAQTTALRPPPLSSHVMSYHSPSETTLLFGGSRPDRSFSNTLWAWDGETWTALSESGPPPRIHAAMAYDSQRDRLVVQGGIASREESFGDTWEWDGTSWKQIAVTQPGPGIRDHHAMAFDSRRGVCVLFGGQNLENEYLAETWEWNGGSWKLATTSGPPPRGTHRLTYNQQTQRVMLVGGWGPDGQFNDTWSWDGKRWRQEEVQWQDTEMTARGAARMAYDDARNQLVLFGGYSDGSANDETWLLDRSTWQQKKTTGPAIRNVHGMAYDSARERVVLYGGIGANGKLDDTWEWDGENWRCIIPATHGGEAKSK